MGLLIELAFVFLIRFWRALLIALPAGFVAYVLAGNDALTGIVVFVAVFVPLTALFVWHARRRRALGYDTPLQSALRSIGRRFGG
jgi:uncharacterized membrane protein (DUF485 family)